MFFPSIFPELTSQTRSGSKNSLTDLYSYHGADTCSFSVVDGNKIIVNVAGYEPSNIKVELNEKTRILVISATSSQFYHDISLKYRVSSDVEVDSAELYNGILTVALQEKERKENIKNIEINVKVHQDELRNGPLNVKVKN